MPIRALALVFEYPPPAAQCTYKEEELRVCVIEDDEKKKFFICVGFYGPVNNEVMSSRSVNSSTVPGQA